MPTTARLGTGDAYNTQLIHPQFIYDPEREEQEMAYIQTEIEDAIRGYGDNALRGLQRNLRPVVCSFAEAPVHQFGRSANGGGTPLPYVSREDRAFGARADGADDNDPDPFADYHNVEPMKFPENCDDIVKQSWYHKGRIDGQREQFEKLMPVIDGMLERVSDAYRS